MKTYKLFGFDEENKPVFACNVSSDEKLTDLGTSIAKNLFNITDFGKYKLWASGEMCWLTDKDGIKYFQLSN